MQPITSTSIYLMKVTLKGPSPKIWRQIQVQGGTTLNKLHRILQAAMGWGNLYRYEFIVGDAHYGEHHPEYHYKMKSDNATKLYQVATQVGAVFTYLYDFNNGWEHEMVTESIKSSALGLKYALCLSGERACPPEDCAIVGGYDHFMQVIANPKDKEFHEMMQWAGGSFNPERFDINDVNERLKNIV